MKYVLVFLINMALLWSQEDTSPNIVTDETKFFNDYTIEADEINNDNIRVVGGDLYVYGTVGGKITVVGGNITLGSTSVVNGTIVAIGGSVQKDENAVIHGKIIETNMKEGLVYREMEPAESVDGDDGFKITERSLRATESWIHPERDYFIYNRNEGMLFTPLNSQWDGGGKSSFRLSFSIGYRFGPDELAGRLTLERSFFSNVNLVIFGSVFKESRTDDYYRLSETENTWAGLLGRQDFYDRWDEKCWSAGIGIDLNRVKIKLLMASVEQDSLEVTSNLWSLFEKERSLRTNPNIEPQESIDYLQATVAFQTRHYSPIATGMALFIQGEAFQKVDDGSSLSSFELAELQKRTLGFIKMNWDLSFGLVFRSQFMAGTSDGDLPVFRKFGIGGLGSVSAFPFKYQTGDQMLQANGEIVFTQEFTDSWFFLKLFADGGYAWNDDTFNFNKQNTLDYGISSAGIGIGSDEDEDLSWSLNIAKPLDDRDYLETTIRIDYNF